MCNTKVVSTGKNLTGLPWTFLKLFKMLLRTEESLPVPGSTESKRVATIRPSWLDEVKPYRETAYFWH